MLAESDYANIGRFITTVASAESVTAKLWWHLSFLTGATLTIDKVQRAPITDKLKALRALVPLDGSRLDQQLAGIDEGFSRICLIRNALVHGFTSENGHKPFTINLRNDYQILVQDLPPYLPWTEYVCQLSIQAYGDATRGIYAAEEDIAPLRPIIESPRGFKPPIGPIF